MNINDLISELKWILSINTSLEDLLSSDLNCMDTWEDEISDWFRACDGLREIIEKLEGHSEAPK